ncbi:MAG: TIGR00725 family protein [Chloroflexi bacterium RBG_16_56_11]|nr:MAG: TIGR00725 family protein [Chloroflexi bacterium RBG_16_56_11]
MNSKPVFIGVIGGGEASAEVERTAEEVGREIARRGAVLVCGGLTGVMEAACRGAAGEGGMTVGILPGDDRRTANPHVKIPVVTGIGYARNVIVVKSSQAVIAVDGSYGTLSEIAHALQSGIPVIGLGTWSVSINGRKDNNIITASSPEDAVEKAMASIKCL